MGGQDGLRRLRNEHIRHNKQMSIYCLNGNKIPVEDETNFATHEDEGSHVKSCEKGAFLISGHSAERIMSEAQHTHTGSDAVMYLTGYLRYKVDIPNKKIGNLDGIGAQN